MARARNLWIFVVALSFAGLAGAARGEKIARIKWHEDPTKAWAAMLEKGRPILLFVTMDGCTYCAQMKHTTYNDRRVRSDIALSFVPLRVDMETAEEWLNQFKVSAYHTTLIISPEQRLMDHIGDYLPANELRGRLGRAVSKLESSADDGKVARASEK